MNGSPQLQGSPALTPVEQASEDGLLFLSSISLWEIATFARQGRLKPAIPLHDWMNQSLETPGLRVIDIEPAIATEAASLPGAFPGDGVDRLIVATARSRHAFLLTADQNLRRYAADGHVRILEV